MGEKKREWEVQRAEERGGEQERYALLEDWERKTTGRSEREGSRERGVKKIKKTERERPDQGVMEAKVSCERGTTFLCVLVYVITKGVILSVCVCLYNFTYNCVKEYLVS